MATCLFLGSGFSYELVRTPIQANFLKQVLAGKRKERIDFLKIVKMPLSKWMEKVGNIEVCMSHLHNLAYSELATPGSKEKAKMAIINFRSAIRDYLLTQTKINREKMNLAFKFMDHINHNGDKFAVLTMNYDLLAENIIEQKYGENQYEYCDIPLRRVQLNGERRGAIPLFKLHGSINWMEERKDGEHHLKGGHPELIGVDPLYITESDSMIGESRNGYWIYRHTSRSPIYTPILIPFFHQKEEWLGQRWRCIFERHWASAKQWICMNNVETIYFVGYKLPDADSYVMSWLLSCLESIRNKKKTLPRIVIINKRENREKEPLEKALEPFCPHVDSFGLAHYVKNN